MHARKYVYWYLAWRVYLQTHEKRVCCRQTWTPTTMASKIFALRAYTQSYDWGKLGSASKAAAYACVATPGFEVDEGKPYAEVGRRPPLWTTCLSTCRVFRTAN